MDAAQPIQSYAQLVQVLRERISEIGTTYANIDVLSGMSDRYLSHILGPKPDKRFGPLSLFCVLPAVAMRLMLVPDDDALARLKTRSDWAPLRRPGPRFRPSRTGRNGPAPTPHRSRRRGRPPINGHAST